MRSRKSRSPAPSPAPAPAQVRCRSQFATRSGTNRLDGSAYHYWRQPEFNSNYYFNKVNNLPKNEVVAHQYGFRQGGPIVIPGLYDGRNKAFFFFNFERLYQPSSATRTRTMLRPEAQAGVFGYNVTVGGRSSAGPWISSRWRGRTARSPRSIRPSCGCSTRSAAATNSTGTINDTGAGNTLQYVYQSEGMGNQYAPTGRVDFNLSDKHRLSGSYWWQRFTSSPDLLNNADPPFPGLSNFGTQNSYRTTGNATLRSTLSANLVNELRGGWQWSPNDFFANVTADQFAEQDGFALTFANVNNAAFITGPTGHEPGAAQYDDLEHRQHAELAAGRAQLLDGRRLRRGLQPREQLQRRHEHQARVRHQHRPGSRHMFTAANFPSATGGQLNEARALYAILTGRVMSIPGTARLDSAYRQVRLHRRPGAEVAAVQLRRVHLRSVAGHAGADAQRGRALGSAHAVHSRRQDLVAGDDRRHLRHLGAGRRSRRSSVQHFQSASAVGQLDPGLRPLRAGRPAHKTNWFDFAPNVGVAWRPNVQSGWLRALLGDPEQATIRAGYALSYNQERIDRFTANAGANPGGTVGVTRDLGTGYPLVLPGESAPVLLSQRSRLGPPAFPSSPVYPIAATTANSVNIFPQDRHLKTPRVHSYSVGFQRSLGRDMALEVRYVGNQNPNTWAEEDWNERSVFDSGFFDEFKLAQRNISANIAAGHGEPRVRVHGRAGHVAAADPPRLSERRSDANNPAAYTSTNFTKQAFVNRFSALRPQVTGALAAIDTAAFRANALAAGLPRNLIVMNPMVSSSQRRDGQQLDEVQQPAARAAAPAFEGAARRRQLHLRHQEVVAPAPRWRRRASRSTSPDDRNSPHAFKMNWDYELPLGRGRRSGRT